MANDYQDMAKIILQIQQMQQQNGLRLKSPLGQGYYPMDNTFAPPGYRLNEAPGPYQVAGDVVPFRGRPQRGEVPGLPATGPAGGRMGGGVVPMQGNSLGGWLQSRGLSADKVRQTLELQKQHGIPDSMIKHERMVWEQAKAREQATLDKKTGVDPGHRKAFEDAARNYYSRPRNED
jgi:hypothetical protein